MPREGNGGKGRFLVESHFMYRYESSSPSRGLVSTDLRFLYCGTLECAQDLRLGPAVWDHWRLGFVEAGQGELEVSGRRYALGPGDCFVIPPTEVAAYRPGATAWAYNWVAFDGANAATLVLRCGFSLKPVVTVTHPEAVVSLFQGLFEASANPQSGDLRLLGDLYRLLAYLADQAPPERLAGRSDPDYVTRAMEWLSLQYSRDIRIAELAQFLGLHRRYLSRIFRQKTGQTPQQYLTGLRVARAQALLVAGALSVAEVSRSVGYQDPFTFSKVFRSRTGVAPSAWGRSPLL